MNENKVFGFLAKSSITILASVVTVACNCVPEITATQSNERKAFLENEWNIHRTDEVIKNQNPEIFYRQALNKKAKCLLPVTEQFMDKSIKLYWDGECKKSYAYGLGREITVNDNIHVEVITILNNDDIDTRGAQYKVFTRDYVAKTETGLTGRRKIASELGFKTYVTNEPKAEISQKLGEFAFQGKEFLGQETFKSNPSYVKKISYNPYISYVKNTYNDANAEVKSSGVFVDNLENKETALSFTEYQNGDIKNFYNNKEVLAPKGYWDDYERIITDVENTIKSAIDAKKEIEDMVDSYKNKACGNSVNTDSIPADVYKQICSFEIK